MHTISAEQLLKAYNGKYKYVTKSIAGHITLWPLKPILTSNNSRWASLKYKGCDEISIDKIAITEFQNKPWHECIYKAKPSEEDWVGKLCFFWDSEDEYEKRRIIDVLESIDGEYPNEPYAATYRPYRYLHCRPVRPDEIKLFNDDTAEE